MWKSFFDRPNCSEVLSFKILAGYTKLLVSAKALKSLELQVSLELRNVKEWCVINELSINLKGTNYMKKQEKKIFL